MYHSLSICSGAIKPTSIWDRLAGRYDSYIKLEFKEGVDDHMSSEYIRIFEQLVIDEQASKYAALKVIDCSDAVILTWEEYDRDSP